MDELRLSQCIENGGQVESFLTTAFASIVHLHPYLARNFKVVGGTPFIGVNCLLVPSHNPEAETPITRGEYLRVREEGQDGYCCVRVERLFQSCVGDGILLECREVWRRKTCLFTMDTCKLNKTWHSLWRKGTWPERCCLR
jgi:hypothetical protein